MKTYQLTALPARHVVDTTSVEYQGATLLESGSILSELHRDLWELDELTRAYSNLLVLYAAEQNGVDIYALEADTTKPTDNNDTPAVADTPATSKWKLTDTIKKVIKRLGEFFDKFFVYIGGVFMLNIKAVTSALDALVVVLDKPEYRKKIEQNYDINTVPIDALIKLIDAADALISGEKKRATTIAGLVASSDADKLADIKSGLEKERSAFKDAVDESNFGMLSGKKKKTASESGWADITMVKQLISKCNTLVQVINDSKSMQSSVDKIITSLEKTSSSDVTGALNKELLAYLKNDLAKQYTKIIGSLGQVCNDAGKTARQLVGLVR